MILYLNNRNYSARVKHSDTFHCVFVLPTSTLTLCCIEAMPRAIKALAKIFCDVVYFLTASMKLRSLLTQSVVKWTDQTQKPSIVYMAMQYSVSWEYIETWSIYKKIVSELLFSQFHFMFFPIYVENCCAWSGYSNNSPHTNKEFIIFSIKL